MKLTDYPFVIIGGTPLIDWAATNKSFPSKKKLETELKLMIREAKLDTSDKFYALTFFYNMFIFEYLEKAIDASKKELFVNKWHFVMTKDFPIINWYAEEREFFPNDKTLTDELIIFCKVNHIDYKRENFLKYAKVYNRFIFDYMKQIKAFETEAA